MKHTMPFDCSFMMVAVGTPTCEFSFVDGAGGLAPFRCVLKMIEFNAKPARIACMSCSKQVA